MQRRYATADVFTDKPTGAAGSSPAMTHCDQASAASNTIPRALRRMTCGGCPNARRKARRIRLRSAKPV
jgi:hypothetical protein